MQIDVQSKSKSLLGVSDLTLVATIKRGLIPALDSRSYETRLRLLLKTLNTLRISSLEAQPTPLITDAVDRVRALHSFRLAIVGQEPKQLLLAVTFDGGWEAYMRRIWRDLGPLLDVIFCNCEGYLLAHDHSFAEYAGWVRSAQVNTEFFYNASPLTVNDLHYLREKERQRTGIPLAQAAPGTTLFEQALPALTALYRLSDMYPPEPGLSDGGCLLRAALHLLKDLSELLGTTQPPIQGYTATEAAALNWFAKAEARKFPVREDRGWDPRKVQGGIIKPYEDITHGCLLLIELKDAAAARAMLAFLEPDITHADAQSQPGTTMFVNLGFTMQGLQLAGVSTGTLDQLPPEFREGMAARAGILGDLLYNHPTRWTLPARNWPAPAAPFPDCVTLSSVHAVVQYVCRDKPSNEWEELVADGRHPLAKTVGRFDTELSGHGVRILSVQAMQRFIGRQGEIPRDHFGFVDGISQPTVEPANPPRADWDRSLPGDFLLGHENSLDDPPLNGRLWDDSTFLVIRKLRQDSEALNAALPTDPGEAARFKSILMGRSMDGENLIQDAPGNDFDYAGDPDGTRCPLQAHVRRANPRNRQAGMPPVPRIIRRGMSYGPRTAEPNASGQGVMFMAYNASIAEQFEVIQAWLNGGNSRHEHTYSALRDPILGVRQDDDPRTFSFKDRTGKEYRLDLSPDRPFVKLEWGLYVFVPSIKALEALREIAQEAALIEAAADEGNRKKKEARRMMQRAAQAQKGAFLIARLNAAEQMAGFEAAKVQWKIALEDVGARSTGLSQAIWTAVRDLHDGVLRTPYGVLVCTRERVKEVFDNRRGFYTATGYADRMRQSFGEIYLGMDDGPQYRDDANKANAAISSVTCSDAFDSAFERTKFVVRRLVGHDIPGDEITVDVKDVADAVLAGISNEWFGLPDDSFVVAGGWHWRSDGPPTCPGHFHSPSRYMFQPNPGEEATRTGRDHGQALRVAVGKFVDGHRRRGTTPGAPLAGALFNAIPDNDDRLARTLIGAMMGFLPTVDGNLRSAMYEWVSDRSLWDHQIAYLADAGKDPLARARSSLLPALQRTLQLRPVPELVWRSALARHRLGPVDVNPGDRIVVSIVSATQECLINDDPDLYPIFGGKRSATPHPTHACPGYEMAIGVMLGVLAGLLEIATLGPTMTPMALRLSRRR